MKPIARRRGTIAIVLIALLLSTNLGAWENAVAPDKSPPETVGYLAHQQLSEASGIAFSRLRPDILWAINDSGNPPRLYAVGLKGEDRGAVDIATVNRDWEDLAACEMDGEALLVIADVGDNRSRNKTGCLIVVREPRANASGRYGGEKIQPLCRIPFRYEDGPRNCEAIAVDEVRRVVLLLSKEDPAFLYELPLTTVDQTEAVVALRIGIFQPALPSFASPVNYLSQPTAMDVAPDGGSLVVLNYLTVLIFDKQNNENWKNTLTSVPASVEAHMLRQAEAVCFAPDGKAIYITSEERPAPLLRLDFRQSFSPEQPVEESRNE